MVGTLIPALLAAGGSVVIGKTASSSAGEGRWGGGAVVDRGHYTACSRHSIMLCQLWIRMLWLMPVSCVPETDDSNDSSSSIASMLCLLMNFLLVMRFCVTGLGRRASGSDVNYTDIKV